MRRLHVRLLAAGAVLACACGCSSMLGSRQAGHFEMVDADGDTRITVDEFTTHFFTTVFNLLDQDDNGRIEKAEWLGVEKDKDAEKLFQSLDADKDDVLTYTEFATPPKRRETIRNLFRTLDRNNDGLLDEAELSKR